MSSQSTQQKFPFKYEDVFDKLILVLPQIGFKVKSSDRVIGRVTASAGMSLFSWGENLTIIVEKTEENQTLVAMESALKVGVNLAGLHRHQKNFNKIIETLSAALQSG